MKKIFLISLLSFVCFSSISGNIKLQSTPENCKKVNGYGGDDKMAIASKYQVSVSSVKLIRTKWGAAKYGDDCILVFDTDKGPKQCQIFDLLSDDNGKTAFGVVSANGNTMCF